MTLSPRPSSGSVMTCASRAAAATRRSSARLQPSAGPGQATHKIALRTVADVDAEALHLVRLAYDQNG